VVLHEQAEFPKGTTLAYPNQSAWPPPPYVLAPPTNAIAIAALILVFVFFPIGIVLGHVARSQIRRTREGGKGLATAALIIGYLQVAVIVAVIAVAAILVALGAQ
jgi:peptidyl-prolyl cis-trans isomerase B (cyclophilin B)